MKYLGLILVVALMAGQVLHARIIENYSSSGSLEYSRLMLGPSEKFHNFLEVKARKMLREGDDKMGLPVMDPYVKEQFDYVLNEELVTGNVQLKNLVVTSLANYTVNHASISIFTKKVALSLTWPRIHGKGLYNVDAVVSKDFHVYGEGEFEFVLSDLHYETVAYVTFNNGLKIKQMTTKITLGGLQLTITGLLGDEELSKYFGEIISEAAPQLIEDYQTDLVQRADKIVMDVVSKKFEGKSMKEVLEILS